MKHFNFFMLSMCIALGSLFVFATSCCDPDNTFTSGDDNTDNPEIPNGETPLVIEMKDGQLNGVVYDVTGTPVSGVSVVSGTSTAITDGNGIFSFNSVQVANNRTVVKFQKAGFFDVVRSLDFADTDNWQVVMVRKGNGNNTAQETYPSSADKEFNFSEAQIKLPGGQYVDKYGNPYTGDVTTDVLYLDPDDENFSDIMPGGDLAAKSNDGSSDVDQLVSYGMMSVSIKDKDGEELKLKDNTPATITITPSSEVGVDIPSWVFNPETGLWEPAGNSTRRGNSYVITVSNVSWVNLDYPAKRCYMQGTVKDESGEAVSNVRVHVGQVYATTNKDGFYSTFVPINTGMKVRVESYDYSNYTPVVEKIVMSGVAGSKTTCDLTLPKMNKITGKIVSYIAPNMRYSVWLTYNKTTTRCVLSEVNGVFYINTPKDYTGNAALNIRTSDGSVFTKSIEINGGDMELGDIVIDQVPVPSSGDMLVRSGSQIYDKIEMKKTPRFDIFYKYGCQMTNKGLIINSYEKDDYYGSWSLEIPDYSSDVTEYDNAKFSYSYERGGDGRRDINSSNVRVTVKQELNKIIVSFKSDQAYYSYYRNGGDDIVLRNAIIEAENLEFDIDFRSVVKDNLYSDELPAFASFLGNLSCDSVGVTMKNAYCDKEIIVNCKDRSREHAKSLINLIKSNGMVNYNANQDELTGQDYYNATYYSGKNFIAIRWRYGDFLGLDIIENLK